LKRIAVILCMCYSIIRAQDTSTTLGKYKVTLTYGIAFMQPDKINDHITTSNDDLGSNTTIIKSMPEAAVSFSIRPMEDSQIITARVGWMYIERIYDVIIPETTTSPITNGNTSGTIKERYTMYPLSFGVGFAPKSFGSQLQFEFIYGLGYIDEDQSYTSSTGVRTKYSRTLLSSAYGFRVAGHTTVKFSELIGLTLELGYRYLVFNDYVDQVTNRSKDIEFRASGLSGAVGLSIIF
jgi:hypothetical protein